jgi:hypothetical protein
MFVLTLSICRAADDPKKPEARVKAGRVQSADGTIVRRESPDKPWQVVKEFDTVYTGDLLITGSQGSVLSANGGARLSAIGSMTGVPEFPILETGVIFHEAKDVDFDFTLDRGRVDLINAKKKSGAARVRVHVRDYSAVITLPEPGDHMIFEIYGQWLKGAHFKKDAKPDVGPSVAMLALAIQGDITIKGADHEVSLKPPPGPALLVLDNLADHSPPVPKRLEDVPEWVQEGRRPPIEEKKSDATKKFSELMMKKSIPYAVDQLTKSDSVDEQIVAMHAMGALDDLERLWKTMQSVKNQEVWDAGVQALRNWIGRGPGQDQKLYNAMIEKLKVAPEQAETIMQLLYTYGDEDLARPQTYETLIAFLGNDNLVIRGLAYWHLERLVPQGKKLGYSPLKPKDERDKAIRAWQDLVPPKVEGSGSKGNEERK